MFYALAMSTRVRCFKLNNARKIKNGDNFTFTEVSDFVSSFIEQKKKETLLCLVLCRLQAFIPSSRDLSDVCCFISPIHHASTVSTSILCGICTIFTFHSQRLKHHNRTRMRCLRQGTLAEERNIVSSLDCTNKRAHIHTHTHTHTEFRCANSRFACEITTQMSYYPEKASEVLLWR